MSQHIIHWNGKNVPDALLNLQPGDYVIVSADDVPPLTLEEDAGIGAALASDRGRDLTLEQVKDNIGKILRR